MSDYVFQLQGEDKIQIDGPSTSIIRTRKDFETFNEYINSTVNEILLPQLYDKDFVRWVQDVLCYNPNFCKIELIKNFLTNESFYIPVVEDDKFKFLRKYSDFIENTWNLRSNYEHIGIFVDKDSEEHLYEMENKFRTISKIHEELVTSFNKQLTITQLLNEKCEFLKQNLKYFMSNKNFTMKIGLMFTTESSKKKIIMELDLLANIFNSIRSLFDRKRRYYEKYRIIKEKLMKDKLQPDSKEETLYSPQAVLEELMAEIKKYNTNLIEFLGKHAMILSVETQMAQTIEDINCVLSGNCE